MFLVSFLIKYIFKIKNKKIVTEFKKPTPLRWKIKDISSMVIWTKLKKKLNMLESRGMVSLNIHEHDCTHTSNEHFL